MKKTYIFKIIIAAVIVSSIALTGCTEVDENKIIVGTSADFPPFEYVDDNQNIIGFDIDLIKSILIDQGYTVEVQDISFDSLIASLQSGKIDVIAAGMTITDERDEQIDFSDPYFEADQSILVNSDTDKVITNSDDLINLTIGAQTGTTGAGWINKNLDAIILDKPVALFFEEDADFIVTFTIVTEEYYGFGVEEDNSDLLNDINEGLNNIQNSEEWNNLIEKYFE